MTDRADIAAESRGARAEAEGREGREKTGARAPVGPRARRKRALRRPSLPCPSAPCPTSPRPPRPPRCPPPLAPPHLPAARQPTCPRPCLLRPATRLLHKAEPPQLWRSSVPAPSHLTVAERGRGAGGPPTRVETTTEQFTMGGFQPEIASIHRTDRRRTGPAGEGPTPVRKALARTAARPRPGAHAGLQLSRVGLGTTRLLSLACLVGSEHAHRGVIFQTRPRSVRPTSLSR